MVRKAYIKQIDYYLPADVVSNEDIVTDFPEWSVEKIARKVGVNKRHVASKNETASDLAIKAAERLFAKGEVSRDEIDYVLFCTQSPDYFLPTSACIIQDKLGCVVISVHLISIWVVQDMSMVCLWRKV